jgi:hypothetical protein
MQLNKAIQQYKETEEEFMTKQKKGKSLFFYQMYLLFLTFRFVILWSVCIKNHCSSCYMCLRIHELSLFFSVYNAISN